MLVSLAWGMWGIKKPIRGLEQRCFGGFGPCCCLLLLQPPPTQHTRALDLRVSTKKWLYCTLSVLQVQYRDFVCKLGADFTTSTRLRKPSVTSHLFQAPEQTAWAFAWGRGAVGSGGGDLSDGCTGDLPQNPFKSLPQAAQRWWVNSSPSVCPRGYACIQKYVAISNLFCNYEAYKARKK